MNNLEIEIKNTSYTFKAGFAFLHKVNKEVTAPVDGFDKKKEIGLPWLVANIIDGDIDFLVKCLLDMNMNQTPRLTKEDLEEWLEEEVEDIDAVFKVVIDFLLSANVCKKALAQVAQEYKKMQEVELKKTAKNKK